MLELTQLLTFSLAAFIVIIAPGPMVTIVIANALRHGANAGLTSVAGGLAGLIPMVAIIALGLETAATHFAVIFEWIRIVGALYLIWLGYKMIRSGLRAPTDTASAPPASRNFFAQAFLVSISNPKSLLFFGAFLPQFVDPARGDPASQTMLLGLLFILIAGICDSAYALAAGKAGGWLSRHRQAVEMTSGVFMTAGGLWMALRGRV